jgi:hypothetical protein
VAPKAFGSAFVAAAALGVAPLLGGVPPIVGPEMRVDVGAGKKPTNETSCASLHRFPGEIVATWNDYRESKWRCGVGMSLDGESWTDILLRPPKNNQGYTEGDPMTAYDHRTDTLWVGAISFTTNGGVFVARKKRGENDFEPVVMARKTSYADKCWMAAGPAPDDQESTNVYVAYNEGVIRSTDMGDTWNTPKSLGSGLGFLPRVAPDGTLYVAYWDAGSNFYIRRSEDAGKNFTSAKRIAKRVGNWGIDNNAVPGTFRCPPLVSIAVDAVDPATVYAAFPDQTKRSGGNTDVDVYFSTSTDGGDTWSTPTIVNGDQGNVKADSFFPWIETDTRGRIHVFYYDTRNKSQNDSDSHAWIDTYYAYSDDKGSTWGELRVTEEYWDSEKGTNGFIGDYLGSGVAANRIHLCYPTTAADDLDTYVTTITDPRADMNCDSDVNFDDIDPFVTALVSQGTYEETYPDCNYLNGDLDDSGVVDFNDIDRFIVFLTAQ